MGYIPMSSDSSDQAGKSAPPRDPGVPEVERRIRELDRWTLERQKELTAIPAPPFGEAPRARRMAELFEEIGLSAVHTDEEGNVLGELPHSAATGDRGADAPPAPLILSAHLDTVFPEGTDTEPREDGEVIRAPGITDDGRGLAALLTLARVFRESAPPLPFPLLFAATVGEEGSGNLRGVRHVFREDGGRKNARAFISLDGVGTDRIITRGIGSLRLRVEVEGPGGHSWADWGAPNPIHLLARVVTQAQGLPRGREEKATLTVARWGGGKSINAIPQEAWIEVDLRSESPRVLDSMEEGFRGFVEGARSSATSGSRDRDPPPPPLELRIRELGRRPAGSTPSDAPLVRAAMEATRALGNDPLLLASSTDANIPMSLGIPAITMGAGGRGGGVHTLEEWYRNDEGPEGILRALLTVLLLAT